MALPFASGSKGKSHIADVGWEWGLYTIPLLHLALIMNTISKSNKNFLRKIINISGKAINTHKMVEADDKILIAVSGGKDSLALIDILAERRKFLPIHYELHAIHIITDDVPYEIDKAYLTAFCEERDVTLHLITTHAGIEEKSNKKPCFTCSWNRRKELFDFALKNGFKKIALGHHLDDAIETLMMNMVMHANISSIPPTLQMFNGKLLLIRPLIYATNAEMTQYAEIKQFTSLKKECPYEDHTSRNTARQWINQFEKLNPQARSNLFKSMSNIDQEYLPNEK
ncbi:tRNA lysidine(34) synthetase [Saccharicrinis fermentans]|uniref:tRNA 2-thiocytidine biosynthesis protein TtcA n=1 Tax=Saccharicrinis fermentans DSM 9555 = JCM 21142 TaxID=869213 RepID=W7YAY1_9BACT|nr:tRNA 2-thiocytidine biosynthesis TtcA family protein [Saccharicrinis fermentans]GAF04773.1 tRNA 2-thiocytidine biosynthesis protein TtcA [Saccharicrinis fermentans DSM 9555 = JCM 21142]